MLSRQNVIAINQERSDTFFNSPTICHVSGKENTVADTLSWLNINTLDTTTFINFNRLAKAQQGGRGTSASQSQLHIAQVQ